MTVYLSTAQLTEIAVALMGEPGIRDAGLLASAATRPQLSAFGQDAYPSLCDKAAALLHSLARNHPLVDGNKRLSWVATRASLLLNGHDLRYTVDEAEATVLAVARGELDARGLSSDLESHLVAGRR